MPCLDKLDVENFFKDLPKYKPWLTPSAREDWVEFEKNVNDLKTLNPAGERWPLPALLSASIVSCDECSQAVSSTLDFDTAVLLDKETTQPPKVSMF